LSTTPQKTERDYNYDPDEEEVKTTENSTNDTNNKQQELYSQSIKDLAQSKVFEIEFLDGSKKIYRRRKAGLGEIGDYTEKQQMLYNMSNQTSPKKANENLVEFYTYAASIFLIETKNNGKMTKEEVKNTVFEDFRKIISACEFASIFNPN
jgi:hypothetical protein